MITPKDVKHVAGLARIELSPNEEQKFLAELSAILEFVEKLNEVDTEHTEPMSGGTTSENVVRADEQMDKNLEGKAMALTEALPDKKGGFAKVKAVFE